MVHLDAGCSWNLSGECSFGFFFTACKQAYLVVLTVNVVIFLLWCFKNWIFFLAACVLWVKAAQTSGWPGLIQSWCKHLLTVFFFIKCLLSVMNVFISGPALTSAKNFLSVWDWGGGRTPFYFCFVFVLRISSWESKMIHRKNSHNHNLWSWPFCGRTDFIFFPTKRKWSMAFNIFFLSYTWQSVGFLFHVFHYGCFFAHMFLRSHWMTAH